MKLYDVIRREHPEELSENIAEEVFVPSELPIKKKKHFIFITISAVVLCGLYILGIYFVRATVTIEERSIPFNLDKTTIEISHENKSSSERLSFQTMTVTTEISREVFGSELKETTGKARGSVIFFNEYAKTAVTIKSGTRLIAQNNKTYTTTQTATVPGYKMDGKKKTPGTSPSISILATDTGPTFNSEGTSLTISGYTGSKRTQLYARSVGNFTGGQDGMLHSVSDAERPGLLESLKTQLSERLRRETRAQVPEQLVTYPDLQFISIDSESLKLEGEGVRFPAKIKGTMVSYLIPRNLFEAAIAKEALSDHSYSNVSIPNIDSLSITPKSGIPANPQMETDSISIEVSGQGNIITQVDPEKIRSSLLGIKKASFTNVLSNIPEISSAKFSLTPFWAPFFPKQASYIKINFK